MQAVPVRRVVLHQLGVDQVVKQIPGLFIGQIGQRGGDGKAQVLTVEQAQQAEHPCSRHTMRAGQQILVAALETRADRAVVRS